MALPFLQIVATKGDDEEKKRAVAAVEAPPEVEVEEELPPEPEPEPEQPEIEPEPDFNFAEVNINMGNDGGGLGAMFGDNLSDVLDSASDLLSSVGNEVTPQPLECPPPQYPTDLRRRGIAGIVTVEFVVDTTGRVVNPRVTSSPNRQLNEPAIAAIRQWRFEPGMRDGSRANFKLSQSVRFG